MCKINRKVLKRKAQGGEAESLEQGCQEKQASAVNLCITFSQKNNKVHIHTTHMSLLQNHKSKQKTLYEDVVLPHTLNYIFIMINLKVMCSIICLETSNIKKLNYERMFLSSMSVD